MTLNIPLLPIPPRQQYTRLDLVRGTNRLLYSRELHRYIINLGELYSFWASGTDIHITDRKSGRDITAAILMRMLADQVEQGVVSVRVEGLRELSGIKESESWQPLK